MTKKNHFFVSLIKHETIKFYVVIPSKFKFFKTVVAFQSDNEWVFYDLLGFKLLHSEINEDWITSLNEYEERLRAK